jgi:hypothetical protein
MKKIIYLLALLFCIAGCQKQEVNERLAVTRVSFVNKTQLMSSPTLKYDNKAYGLFDKIPSTYGDNKVEIYDGVSGEKLIDTVLNIKGPHDFYVYQPFDIVRPVIVDSLPLHPPVDPRNPLKNETPAPEGYVKIKIALQKHFVLPNQKVELVVLSKTAASPDIAVPIQTLHAVGTDYSTTLLQVKRPVLADGSLSQTFNFSLIDPATGEQIKTGNGNDYKSGDLVIPLGEKNLFMFYFNDRQNASRFASTSIPINGLPYVIVPNIVWSIE